MPGKLIRLALVPLALLAVLIVRLFNLRLGYMLANRIGHCAGNTEVHLCERDAGLTKGAIWCHSDPANAYLLKMWKRVMRIDSTGFVSIVMKVNRLFDGWKAYEVDQGNMDRDVNNLFDKQPPHLKFTEAEQYKGQKTLDAWGVWNARFVCLIVRDSAYLPDLSYHSYRDSNIEDYHLAIKALVDRGYFVFRMGAKVEKPLGFRHPMVFDYATNGMRSEFMDLYLGANCEFCVSTSCGFDAIPFIFRRPVVYVNFAPVEYLSTFRPGLAIWKHHWKDGKRMTPAEIYESGAGQFMTADQFKEAGIELKDNTPEEIRDAVVEMADGLATGPQAEFWERFPRSTSEYTKKPLHGAIRMRVGQKFLAELRSG